MKTLVKFTVLLVVGFSLVLLGHGHGTAFPVPPPNNAPGTAGDVRGPTTKPAPRGPARNPGTGVPGVGTPGAGLTPTTPRPGQPITGMAIQDLSSWHWWWEFNKEPFMQLRSRMQAAGALSGGDGFFLGHGRRLAGGEIDRRPTDEVISQRIVPALREALHARESNDMVSGCLIGLARIGNDRPAEERKAIADTLRPFLRESNQALVEIATVSLGVLAHDPGALLLGDLLLDTPAGRQAVDEHEVPDRVRAFAAYGLAVLGIQTEKEDVRRYIVHRLVRALDADETGTPDVSAACVIALGRTPLAWSGRTTDVRPASDAIPTASSREGQLRFLLDIVRDPKRHRFVQAHAVTSLATLLLLPGEGGNETLANAVADTFVDLLTSKRKIPREVRQSCALALGMVGDGDRDTRDVKIRKTLLDLAQNENDLGTRHFALLSLGRVAARAGAREAVDPGPVRAQLLKMFGRSGTETRRWAALSLALLERTRTEAGQIAAPAVAQAMHHATREARSPSDGGAFSIGCGILRNPEGIDEVLVQLARQNEDISRGHAAVGLGLLGAREALDPLASLVEESTYHPWLLRGTAMALGMLGDHDVVDVLLGKLRDTKSIAAKSSIAQALGRIGDDRTVDPLLEMLVEPEGTKGSRAFAAIALGLVADRDPLPWNTVLTLNMNYMAAPATLYDTEGFGVLNIL